MLFSGGDRKAGRGHKTWASQQQALWLKADGVGTNAPKSPRALPFKGDQWKARRGSAPLAPGGRAQAAAQKLSVPVKTAFSPLCLFQQPGLSHLTDWEWTICVQTSATVRSFGGVECLFHCVSKLFDIFENFSPVDKAPEVVGVGKQLKVTTALNFLIQIFCGHVCTWLVCTHWYGHTECNHFSKVA